MPLGPVRNHYRLEVYERGGGEIKFLLQIFFIHPLPSKIPSGQKRGKGEGAYAISPWIFVIMCTWLLTEASPSMNLFTSLDLQKGAFPKCHLILMNTHDFQKARPDFRQNLCSPKCGGLAGHSVHTLPEEILARMPDDSASANSMHTLGQTYLRKLLIKGGRFIDHIHTPTHTHTHTPHTHTHTTHTYLFASYVARGLSSIVLVHCEMLSCPTFYVNYFHGNSANLPKVSRFVHPHLIPLILSGVIPANQTKARFANIREMSLEQVREPFPAWKSCRKCQESGVPMPGSELLSGKCANLVLYSLWFSRMTPDLILDFI